MAKYALFRFHRICVGAGKAGIITYTRSAGHELEFAQHGVKFICLCPGAVQTSIQVIIELHIPGNCFITYSLSELK